MHFLFKNYLGKHSGIGTQHYGLVLIVLGKIRLVWHHCLVDFLQSLWFSLFIEAGEEYLLTSNTIVGLTITARELCLYELGGLATRNTFHAFILLSVPLG